MEEPPVPLIGETIEPTVTVLIPAGLLAAGERVLVSVQIVKDAPPAPVAPKEELRRFIGGPRQ